MWTGAWKPSGMAGDIEHVFCAADEPEWGRTELARIKDAGKIALLTIEPWTDANEFDLEWNKILKKHGSEVLVRFMHEMNGNWYPWAGRPDQFLDRWREFFTTKPTNVISVWCPNVTYPGTKLPMGAYWPSGCQPSYVGLDGYQMNPGETADEVFRDSLVSIRLITDAPLLICETAAPRPGKNQRTWISDLRRVISEEGRGDVVGIVWFNEDKEQPWKLGGKASRAFSALGG